MKHVLRRTAVVCLAVPAITLLGASAAQADCQPSATGSPSAGASPNPWPSLTTGHDHSAGTCSVHGDDHSHNPSHNPSEGHDMSTMDGMDDMDDMDGMDGMDMGGTHVHGGSGHDGTGEVDRPRTAVLSAFGVVNLGVLASAAVVRRRSRAGDGERHGGTRAAAAGRRGTGGTGTTR